MVEDKRIRVLIAHPTRFLRDSLFEAISDEPDFEVIGEVADESSILAVANRLKPDCLVVPLEQEDQLVPVWEEVLASNPETKIVAMGQGTNALTIYWKCKEGRVRHTYGTSSRRGILQALRYTVS